MTTASPQIPQATTDTSSGTAVRAVAAFGIGVAMLVVAFAYLDRMPGWADRHGAIVVYLGFFVFMSLAGRLFWWGADQLIARLRGRSGASK